jgi:hypothetical protein
MCVGLFFWKADRLYVKQTILDLYLLGGWHSDQDRPFIAQEPGDVASSCTLVWTGARNSLEIVTNYQFLSL